MSATHTLGAYLRRGRERSGLSVEDVAAGSRIVPRLVDALEADRPDLLPAPVYVRGFIRAYCEQVGTDPEEALRLYDEQAGPPPPLTVPAPLPAVRPSQGARRWRRVAAGSFLVVVLGAVSVLLLERRHPDAAAGRGAGAATTGAHPSAVAAVAAVPAVPAVPAPVAPAPPEAVTPPIAPAPSAVAPQPAAGGATDPLERVLLVRAIETTWVRVRPDGAAPTEETLQPGTMREWRSAGRFHVTLGNAGGVELQLDGQALPALGARGQVIRDATVPGEPRP
jgi:cytoskeleton protein RodZ